jgi:hypothetical protein
MIIFVHYCILEQGTIIGNSKNTLVPDHCFRDNNITVEDPTKHLRQAAFLGMWDPVKGSSASVLTGGPVSFGTNGFSLILDNESVIASSTRTIG